MRKLFSILSLAAVLMALSVGAFAQTATPFTTLSAAIADERTPRLTVTSATGFVASTGNLDYGIFIDNEFMRITAVSGTIITVNRAQARTSATAHKSGAYVFYGQYGSQPAPGTTGGPFIQSPAQGSCTRTAYTYMPMIQINASALGGQAMYDCVGGTWSKQTLPSDVYQPSLYKACTVPIGSVAYGSFGTSTTASTTSQYNATVFVPNTFIATGITNLNGSAVDTASKKIFILHSAAGNVIGNSAVAGTAATGNDAFQAIAFTTPLIVTGPATYFIGLQDDTADVNGIRTIATATFNGLPAGVTTSVFGTVSAITVPSTFTADQGPVACIY